MTTPPDTQDEPTPISDLHKHAAKEFFPMPAAEVVPIAIAEQLERRLARMKRIAEGLAEAMKENLPYLENSSADSQMLELYRGALAAYEKEVGL
jgi:hypothetical protein